MERKLIKKDFNKIVGWLIIYMILLNAIMMGYMILGIIIVSFRNSNAANLDAIVNDYLLRVAESGIPYLISIPIGILIMYAYFGRSQYRAAILISNKKMSIRLFGMFVVLMMGVQLVFSVLAVGIEAVINPIGYSLIKSIESAQAGNTAISMIIYTTIGAPISEELIFRGFIMRHLQKYGKLFAIIGSAVLFGMFHGNFIQSIFAFFVGLVFAYVAMEYSIKWSIALHMTNNLVFGELLAYITGNLSEEVQVIISLSMNVIFFVGAVFILAVSKRRELMQYIAENKREDSKTNRKYLCTCACFIIFTIIVLIEAAMGVSKI